MFEFDISNFTIETVRVTRITEALGGSMTIVDENATQLATQEADCGREKIVTKRISIPFAVARIFKKRNHGKSEYVVPVVMAIIRYNGIVVCIERKYNVVFNQEKIEDKVAIEKWVPHCKNTIESVIPQIMKEHKGKWYTDGVTAYCLPDDAYTPENHTFLTSNHRFYAVSVPTFKLSDISSTKVLDLTQTRTVVGFIKPDKSIMFSPPIWKNVFDMRNTGVQRLDATDTENNQHRFDIINEKFFVNLEFILGSAKTVGEQFGFENTRFLQLERHMIRLTTINLPKIPSSQRSTYNTELNFLSCFAWLLGLTDKCKNLEQYMCLRALYKVLTTSGIFNHKYLSATLQSVGVPDMLTKEQAYENVLKEHGDAVLYSYWSSGGALLDENSAQQFLPSLV